MTCRFNERTDKDLLVEVQVRNLIFRSTPDTPDRQAFAAVDLKRLQLFRGEDGGTMLSFSVEVPRDRSTVEWTNENDGLTVWMTVSQAQPELEGMESEPEPPAKATIPVKKPVEKPAKRSHKKKK